ncbi:class I tRNA ligase family protein, partial [Candidatus Kaiserbacteria bacterium]|nr:class I tRNA ligase family protein [Candidatus Kaiserbacteria bacterium]
DFVFYDGPPFATGLPHYGHILAGTIKDAIPRFWTMNGYRVARNWGWDCHGLPLENLIEKKLGLATKRDIEEYGIQNFNEQAREAVLEYADDWKKIIPRMGRFVDMENDYRTMDSTYTESVWWVFKSLHEKGLVYEGFKSMHLCPRCGTTLSNFEVNQGYKDIKDIAVTVKLPLLDEAGEMTDTSLLVWTTTPWTLPGNMAAAIHQDLDYVKVKVNEGDSKTFVVLAKGRLPQLNGFEIEIIEEFKGSELLGKKYQPPFNYLQNQDLENKDKAWTLYHADYVEVGEEGTGAVHIAPAYGDDDMKLAQANNVPIVHHVDEAGHFTDFVTDFAGQLVKPKDDEASGVDHKDADIEILKALQAKGVILKKENITHSYPHCWRCDTPLLNYATTSWFVEVTKIKDQLVEANDKVKWVPEHVGKNRFGKWLDGARDWAVSRQRYWGAPLPIWKNPTTGEYKVFGSLAEIQEYVPKSGNKYFLMRHGEAESNIERVIRTDVNYEDNLTDLGVRQVEETAAELKKENIDLIIVSPFHRTKKTAEIVREKLGLSSEQVVVDERIREIQAGAEFQGRKWNTHQELYKDFKDQFTRVVEGVDENRVDVQKRVGDLLYSLENNYKDRNILIIGHVSSTFATACVSEGANIDRAVEIREKNEFWLDNAEVRKLKFIPIPHNDNYELDFHRPYIDKIDLYEGEVRLERVPDVFDCWFESGSMPYGQHHYPFECAEDFEDKHFPANFIAEGLDQTRGWFYSLIVLGTALFGKSPFENVVVNGTVLAEDGRKMSKSLQNYPDPMDVAHTIGADAMRFYLLSSPGIKGEDFNFIEKEVLELQRKNIGRLHNVLTMYEMFADDTSASSDSDNVLDKWILNRLNQLVSETTYGYKNYELDKATRPITEFVDDLSVWYLRRSRDRFKGEDAEDRVKALATLRHTLSILALVMAPSMPFYAEYLWQKVKKESDSESVHLAKWPDADEVNTDILAEMQRTRDIVTQALEARTKIGIKVRQPISSVSGPALSGELTDVILDELNAKSYKVADSVTIDTNLTPELISEGVVRELMRAVQGRRKAEGLSPRDSILLTIKTDNSGQKVVTDHQDLITKTVGAKSIEFGEADQESLQAGDINFSFKMELT